MTRIRWTRPALRDFNRICNYIADLNPSASNRVGDEILNKVDSLTEFPARGRPGQKPRTRELFVGGWPYVIVYRLDPAETVAVIVRIRHTAMLWP